jgi:hypothetical protein
MIFGGFQIKDIVGRVIKKNRGDQYVLALCCIVKDEDEYLQEWMEYHLKIGVQHFFIYDNESKKAVSDTLKTLSLSQFATVLRIYGKAKQVKAYNDCLSRHKQSCHWIGFIDVDEFIVPKSTKGDLIGFLEEFRKFGGLGINWLVFGSSGHIKRTNQSQLESFLFRSETSFPINRHVKVLVQTKYVKRSIGAHSFSFIDSYSCVNENGVPVTGSYSDVSVDKIQINHYYCRSLEEYQRKIERGLADTSRRKRKIEDFHNHDLHANRVEDREILGILSQNK